MKKINKILQVFEHQTLKVDEIPEFKLSHFKALEKYGYRTKEKFFKVGNQRIKFKSYVGVVQVQNLTIEILPKADKSEENSSKEQWHDALISMLHECKLIKLDSLSNARLKIKSASILDLYIDAFLTETEKLYQRGLRKKYRSVQENLNKLKGKIHFTNHIKKNAFHKERFFIEHKVYDRDNYLNQILLKAINILNIISNNPSFDFRIKKLLINFEGISDVNIVESDFKQLQFNKNNQRYKRAITLAKLIILHYSPDLKGGNQDILAILFDMNVLYENYIYRKLKALQYKPELNIIKVHSQQRQAFWESRGLRADILVETEKNNIIIDTKWKVLEKNSPSDSDLKQMFVYNLHYDTDLSILLYPKTSLETNPKKPFKNENFQDKNCQIAFVDMFTASGDMIKDLGLDIYSQLLKAEIE